MDPSPGWYPDVTRPGQKRWFDGHRWTDHRRDQDDPDEDPPPPTGRREATTDRTTAGWQAGQMPGAAPLPRIQTSGLAIGSIVIGFLWIFGVGSVIGVILGLMALRQIRRSNGLVGGRVLAVVGILVSLTTLGLTALVVFNFDGVVDTVKGELVEGATREELRRAGAAMEAYHDLEGTYPGDVGALVAVDYRPEDDVTLAVGLANPRTWCLEALHRDGETVWHLERNGEPATGRC